MIPAALTSPHPLLAEALSPEQAGEFTFYALTAVIALVLFILSLVRLISTKKTGWVVGLVLSVVLGIGTLGAGITALVKKAGGGNGTPTVVSSTDHHVRARIPGHWNTLTGLNKAATLQVGNSLRGEYFVVLSEPKEGVGLTLDEYGELVTQHIVGKLEKGERGAKTQVTVDGNPALQYELKGVIQKIPVVYMLTTVESPEGFHQLIMWTLQSKKAIAFPIFKDVLESMKVEDTAKGPARDGES